ncbi:MAG: hypothetical protein ACNA8P_02075 [Phycisphaerales bacterium]
MRRHSTDIEQRRSTKPDAPGASDKPGQKPLVVPRSETARGADGQPAEDGEGRIAAAMITTPDLPEFWVWTPIISSQPATQFSFWERENVFPIVRTLISVPFAHGFNAPGRPLPPRRFNPDGTPLEVDPQASAHQLFGYIDWHRDDLLSRGRSNFKYAIWPQNWAGRNDDPSLDVRNGFTLGGNPRDRLDQTLHQNAEYESFYAAHGIALNKQWSQAFVTHLDSMLQSNGLPKPTALFFDLEAAFTNRKAMYWWTAALEDPRADTELIDGMYTMRQIEAMAPAYDPNREIWRPVNREMLAYTYSVSMRVLDYALWEGFWKQAREVWPNVVLSNYGLYGAAPSQPVLMERVGAEVKNASLRFADFASPIMYGYPSYAINTAESVPVHLTRLGSSATGDPSVDRRRLTVVYHKARLDALAAAEKPIAPWICPPSFAGLELEDTLEIMRHGSDLGVRNWLFWSQHPYDWSDIVIAITNHVAQSGDPQP